jgi:hypothetical protein
VGMASDYTTELMTRPVTVEEAAARRARELVPVRPEATSTGAIVDRPRPAVAPEPVFQASQNTWD